MRVTKQVLISEIKETNHYLASRFCLDFVYFGERNGYTLADSYELDINGDIKIRDYIDGSTKKHALQSARDAASGFKSAKKVNRKQAKMLALIYGINFNLDPHQLCNSDRIFLNELAKKANYRKPLLSSLSRCTSFFVSLNKVKYSSNSLIRG